MSDFDLSTAKPVGEFDLSTAQPVTPPTVPKGPIDLTNPADQHERDFIEGRKGQLSPEELTEAIRQYRAIRQSDAKQAQLEEAGQQLGLPEASYGQSTVPAPTTVTPATRPAFLPEEPVPKPWYEPRVTMDDLKGATGQSALASGLATSRLVPPILAPAGFIAGAAGAIIADEGTRRLQEQFGETEGGILGLILSAVSGGATGSAARTKPMGPFSPKTIGPIETETPAILAPQQKPPVILSESTPRGGAYISQEVVTPPSSKVSGGPRGEGQFSTGSGESLFGELQEFSTRVEPPMYGQPVAPPRASLGQPKGTLPEKLPTFEERPLSQAEYTAELRRATPLPKVTTPRGDSIDTGSATPDGQWIPPKDYVEPPTPTRWQQLWSKEKLRWGQELPVLRTHPESPVISAMEGTHVAVEETMERLSHQPWLKRLMKLGDNTKVLEIEENLTKAYKAGRDWMKEAPQDLQEMFTLRNRGIAIENEIRRRRGLQLIPEIKGPYFPRLTDEDFKLMRAITRSQEGAKTAQSVGPFQHERVFETLKEGLAKGVTYRDWRLSLLMREARGAVLQATDQMMTDVEAAGVIHRTKEAAERASLTGKAYPISGLPFPPEGGTWWARSQEEGQFLLQNLRQMKVSDLRGWANQWLRNPSLVNPWPHIMKNMSLKLMQQATASGLNQAAVLRHAYAYRQMQLEQQALEGGAFDPRTWLAKGQAKVYPKGVDMLDEFKNTMPFTTSGRTVWELIESTGPKTTTQQLSRVPGILNSYARRKIFAEWDPAMRYGLWREYVKKGMSPQEAANHTWIDLIRYGTRADRIDAWNSLPFNFFVPWRVGTIRTVNKALDSAPVRFGLFMGAVDTLREIDYRQNGRWTHLPYDYLERPIMTLLMERDPTEALKVLGTTVLAGPSGEYMFSTLRTMLDTMELKGNIGSVRTLAWGIAQIYDLWPQYHAWEKDHNPQHIIDMLGLVALGRHATPFGAPHRLGELIPESLIPTQPLVKHAEHVGETLKAYRGAKDKRQALRDFERLQRPYQPMIPPQR